MSGPRFTGRDRGSASLGDERADQGDGMTIYLTQRGEGAVNIAVYAHHDEGRFFLGRLTAPAPDALFVERSRAVAICVCPGVRQWEVEAQGQDDACDAEIYLTAGCCGTIGGVVPLDPDGRPQPFPPQ